jgi:hypothetical protein
VENVLLSARGKHIRRRTRANDAVSRFEERVAECDSHGVKSMPRKYSNLKREHVSRFRLFTTAITSA